MSIYSNGESTMRWNLELREGKIILNLREMANNAKISIYGSFMSNHNPKTAALVTTSLFLLLSGLRQLGTTIANA